MPEVSVVIVNYKTPKLTIGAIRSCLDEPGVSEVIVVDNASADDSVEQIWAEFRGSKVRVIDSTENDGFGAANNRGVAKARSPYVLLLNSDAFVLEGAVAPLVAVLEQQPDVGIVSPLILESDGSTPQPRTFGPFPTVKTIFTRDFSVEDELQPDWVSAVAIMVRRDEFLDLNGFDEEFFMYYEDVDLCRRYRGSGKRIVREPGSRVVHFGGSSLNSDFRRKRLYYESQDRYLELTGVTGASAALIKASRWPVYIMRTVVRR